MDDTTERNNKDLNEHEESSHDVYSNSPSTNSQKTIQKTSQNRGSDYITRATHIADDFLAASGITVWIFRQSQIYKGQAKMVENHHEDRWTKLVSNWNPANAFSTGSGMDSL